MHFRGTYQKTLARILSAVAIIMALLISVLSGAFLERQTHAEYEYHLEQTAKSQESSATIASNVILNTVLKCASNQSIIRTSYRVSVRADAIECQSLQWQDRGYGADT